MDFTNYFSLGTACTCGAVIKAFGYEIEGMCGRIPIHKWTFAVQEILVETKSKTIRF